LAKDLKDLTDRLNAKTESEYIKLVDAEWMKFLRAVCAAKNNYSFYAKVDSKSVWSGDIKKAILEALLKQELPDRQQAAIDKFIKDVEDLTDRVDSLEDTVGG